jgi:acetolactate synthase-1/2/3 large subunit
MEYRVADAIVDSLVAHGADRGFSVPGESFLALLDALH